MRLLGLLKSRLPSNSAVTGLKLISGGFFNHAGRAIEIIVTRLIMAAVIVHALAFLEGFFTAGAGVPLFFLEDAERKSGER